MEAVARAAAESVPQIRSEGEVLGVWIGREWHESRPFVNHVIAWDPARVLAVCAGAKTLVELHEHSERGDLGVFCDYDGEPAPCPSLSAVAAMFAEPGEES